MTTQATATASVAHDADVIVIGGGPAGSVAARGLARSGRRVVLVDRGDHPRWKVCGCCLSGRGVAALASEGMGDITGRLGARRPSRLVIRHRGRDIELPVDGTVVVSRSKLDAALLDAARNVGVEVRTGWTATLGAVDDDARVVRIRRGDEHEILRARVVLGATGLAPLPSVDEAGTPGVTRSPGSRIGIGAVLPAHGFGAGGPASDRIHMVVGRTGYVGISTLEDGRVDVAAAIDAVAVRAAGGPGEAVTELLREANHPLPTCPPDEGWRGTPELTRSAERPGAERLLLIGDAASYVEPFTGEGMTWAIEDARAVVPHVETLLDGVDSADVLAAWTTDRRNRVRRGRRLVRAVAWISRREWRIRATLGILRAVPALARPFIRSATTPLSLQQDTP
ncbi:MAG TPA: NAD(P)/FAD-dependent oxidoreductase [Longimicrobiales bacterium]|nr:NAD(P)/FAD-dependent oxidoreductase [Longimicrobiales bacterium]